MMDHDPTGLAKGPPVFDQAFHDGFFDLLRWRRDVRRFRTDPVPAGLLDMVLDAMVFAPSVGNSQPWRLVQIESAEQRGFIVGNFERANSAALSGYTGERAQTYARLKLSGLIDAPIVLAVFTDEATAQGHGLGRRTMPEMLRYSTVSAINTLWLVARMHGLGVGWVSIVEPAEIGPALGVPSEWSLTAILCIGWPEEESPVAELERAGWQLRTMAWRTVLRR